MRPLRAKSSTVFHLTLLHIPHDHEETQARISEHFLSPSPSLGPSSSVERRRTRSWLVYIWISSAPIVHSHFFATQHNLRTGAQHTESCCESRLFSGCCDLPELKKVRILTLPFSRSWSCVLHEAHGARNTS